MPKEPEYRLVPEARSDVERIWLHTLEQWGLEQANRYIDELTAAFASLTAVPKRCTPCDYLRPGYRYLRSGHHVVYFYEAGQGVVVVRVLHERMLPSRHL